MGIYKIDNISKKLFVNLICFLSIIFITITSIITTGVDEYIWIEAEDAKTVVEPLQIIEMEGASNNEGIVSTGRHLKNEGYAKYFVWIKEDGNYVFWGRGNWPHVCANSFRISLDNSTMIKIGETPITNQWHWFTGPTFKLKKGNYELFLWNQEQDSRIDKFLLTADFSYIPLEDGLSNDFFFDFENGLIPKSFIFTTNELWRIIKDREDNSALLLTKCSDCDERAMLKLSKQNSYIFRLAYRTADLLNNQLNVFINYADEKNFISLSVNNKIALFTHMFNGEALYSKQILSNQFFIGNNFSDIAIKKENNSYLIKLNGRKIIEYSDSALLGNYVGFSSANGDIIFDNIALTYNENFYYSENFHGTKYKVFNDRPEFSKNYFKRLKEGRGNSWIYSGKYMLTNDGFDGLRIIPKGSEDAILLFGDYFWENYKISIAAKVNNMGDIGVLFNYQDEGHYYCFKWYKEDKVWKYKICKYKYGKEILLCEKEANLLLHGIAYWYNLEINSNNGLIEAFIDNNLVLSTYDKTYSEGKIGFWTNAQSGADFDDIEVSQVNIKDEKVIKDINYHLFDKMGSISKSYADWLPSKDGVIQYKGITTDKTRFYSCLYKNIFETSKLIYKHPLINNFEISIKTSNVPRDVDVILEFNSEDRKLTKCNFLISIDKIIIRCNEEITKTIFFNNIINRNNIKILRIENKWTISIDDNNIFEYYDNTISHSTNMALGYSGIGKAKIFLYIITIKDQL